MGIPDQFIEHGNVDELLAEIGMTADHLVENMESFIKKKAVEREQCMTNRIPKRAGRCPPCRARII